MNHEIKTYSLDIIVNPKPALLLTYSYSDQATRRHKRLMPVRDLHRLAGVELARITGVDVFRDPVNLLKQRHSLHLNAVDDSILFKVIIVLCGLVNNRLELSQCLSHADRILKDFKDDKENAKEPANDQIEKRMEVESDQLDKKVDLKDGDPPSDQASASDKLTVSQEECETVDETKKTAKRQVRFRDKHEEFIFERFDSEESDELIDNLNDKDFLDSMFKNELNYEDLNNNYQPVNYNR